MHDNIEKGVEDGADKQLVSALERGIRILRCFSSMEQALSGKELIERTGLPKATVFRLTSTLIQLGLLRYSERLSKFILAPGLLTLAAPVLTRLTVRQLARPLMQELANHANGQISLAVGDAHNLVFAEIVHGANCTIFRPEIGVAASRSRSATGRAYLASLPEKACAAYLSEIAAVDSAKAGWLAERLEETRRDLATRGFCRNRGDLHREIEGVAVPLSSRVDDLILVFACSVPVFNLMGDQLITDIGPRLVSLVRNIETALGTAHGGARNWTV